MKRVFFISFLFVVLHSSSVFCSLSVDDYKQMEVEGKEPTYKEITQDQTSYENWVAYVDGKTDSHYNLPSFSDVAVLTENLLAYSVGNYADVASGVFDNLVDTFSLGSDIWDFMTFNVQRMAFDYAPDFVDLLKSGVDEEIYYAPVLDGPVVGNWYEVPHNYNGYFVNSSNQNVYTCIIAQGSYSYILTASYDFDAYFTVGSGKYNGTIYHQSGGNCNQTYNGSYVVGYYSSTTYSSAPPSSMGATAYATRNVALADLFGQDWDQPTGEPTLNGNGIIVNDNPVINPVSLTSALGFPFKQTVINNYNNNTPIPWRPNNYTYVDYNYGYEVPFWDGQELETLEYPTEIEFPSVEFETIEVDQSVDTALENLNGSWIVEFFLVAILLLILGLIL